MAGQIITKRCTGCNQIKPLSEFHKQKATKDSLAYYCKMCKRMQKQSEKGKAAVKHYNQSEKGKVREKRHQQTEKGKTTNGRANHKYTRSEKGKTWWKDYRQSEHGKAVHFRGVKQYNIRHPDRVAARAAIGKAVRIGRLPPANSLQCSCGEPAKHYHHHKGYEPKHFLNVLPVCQKCHTKIRLAS